MQGQVEFLKSLFKLSIVAFSGYIALGASYRDFFNVMFMEPTAVPGVMQDLSVRFLSAIVTATVVLVASRPRLVALFLAQRASDDEAGSQGRA